MLFRSETCQLCQNMVKNFIDGLKKTSKGNFGGGNTDWEDKKLGKFLYSESRFEEIIENLCTESECHELLEKYEEELFDWYKNKQDRIETEFLPEFCLKKALMCCQNGTYGAICKLCPRDNGLVCAGRGECDGEGTRGGSGKCNCNSGYTGVVCEKCAYGFYEESREENSLKCTACHESCSKCVGPTAESCLSCRRGWSMNEETKLCEDIDECQEDKKCRKNQFCKNSIGSFNCIDCDSSCVACDGPESNHCVGGCNKGFRSIDLTKPNQCVDIDECTETPNICDENMLCENSYGSYQCKERNTKNKKTKQEDKLKREERKRNLLIKRSLVIGVMTICTIISYVSRQYILIVLSISFGSLVFFLIE